jgi:hypothetical protein
MAAMGLAVLMIVMPMGAMAGEVTMEKTEYGGWQNCVKLTNGETELIVTTDVGPRIIHYGFAGGQNLFRTYDTMLGKTGGDGWRIYGGHRLWHAPEAKPRTYSPDNGPVEHEWNGTTLRLTQPVESDTGIQKQMEITLDGDTNHVTVLHRLVNRNLWAVELAPWSLSVMAQGGRAILPQEPFIPHTDHLLPARPLVLWHYTNMADPRWTWSEKYIQLQQDPKNTTPQKIGMMNTPGWAAYALKGDVFVKRFPAIAGATYPDSGCNCEAFTNEGMLEVESVGPMTTLEAGTGVVEHTEHWFLFKADIGKDDAAIDADLLPLVQQTDAKL